MREYLISQPQEYEKFSIVGVGSGASQPSSMFECLREGFFTYSTDISFLLHNLRNSSAKSASLGKQNDIGEFFYAESQPTTMLQFP